MLCLICVRSGSKGLPNKNVKKINGKTLLEITIHLAKKIKSIKNIIISTDSKNYANIGKKNGALSPFIRPKSLSMDQTNEWDVWKHAIKEAEKLFSFEDVIILPVVSPLRKKEDIIKIINKYKKNKKKAVITLTESSRNPYYNMVFFDQDKNVRKLKQPPVIVYGERRPLRSEGCWQVQDGSNDWEWIFWRDLYGS